MPELFAQVILPLSLHDSYTYSVPELMHFAIKPGQRVIVQFGKKKLYAALVLSISETKPKNIEIKEIQQILDDEPVVFAENFELWNWIAKYYCCTLGDVFRAALPTGLKLESKSKIFSIGNKDENILSEKEELIIDQIEHEVTFLDELQKRLGTKFSYTALKSLLAKNLIFIEEKVDAKYKPKTEVNIRFHPVIRTENNLEAKINELKKAKKQVALVFHFCNKTNAFDNNLDVSISKKELFEGTNFSSAVLNELFKKNILIQFEKQVSRI